MTVMKNDSLMREKKNLVHGVRGSARLLTEGNIDIDMTYLKKML